MISKDLKNAEFGDFQTPIKLAMRVAQLLRDLAVRPASIIEPTCGKGSFILASGMVFREADSIFGVEINADHVRECRTIVSQIPWTSLTVQQGDFFAIDWRAACRDLPEPILIIGNPPWVTSSELGALRSKNIPMKKNPSGWKGIEAITGKSNFDISEVIIMSALEVLQGKKGVLAMLCKTSVVRRVLRKAWGLRRWSIGPVRTYRIDTAALFRVSVDACLLVIDCTVSSEQRFCRVYSEFDQVGACQTMGFHDGHMICDLPEYNRSSHLLGRDPAYVWRSGLKHDCSKVMELSESNGTRRNGLGALVDIEDDFVYPLLKSSDVAKGSVVQPRRSVIVTQRRLDEDPATIAEKAPKTWQYLIRHKAMFDKRASSIYVGRPAFAIFGIGDYSFSRWKVAIAGFYKKLAFRVIGPSGECPVMLDDTVSFLPCKSEEEARFVANVMTSQPVQRILSSMIFWDEKRPITIDILRKVSLQAAAEDLGLHAEYAAYALDRDSSSGHDAAQLSFSF